MPAGRELDALVAERIFGYQVWQGVSGMLAAFPPRDRNKPWIEVPLYSTDIAAAFEVVDKMRDEGWDLWISQTASMKTEPWDVRLGRGEHHLGNHERAIAHADIAPLAICRAALMAMEAKG